MAVDIQAFALLLFWHPQTNHQVSNFVGNESNYTRPDQAHTHTEQLYTYLMTHGDASSVTCTIHLGRGEDTGQDTTDNPAHAVDTEHVTGIIHPQPFLQQNHTPQTGNPAH